MNGLSKTFNHGLLVNGDIFGSDGAGIGFLPTVSVTGDYSISYANRGHLVAVTTASNIDAQILLPTGSADIDGMSLVVKNIGGGHVVKIVAASGNTIDGTAQAEIGYTQHARIQYCHAVNRWHSLISSPPAPFGVLTNVGQSVTWNLNTIVVAKMTITGFWTLQNPLHMRAGGSYILYVEQGSVGEWDLNYGDKYRWAYGSPPNLSTEPGKVDIISFTCDGQYMYGMSGRGF